MEEFEILADALLEVGGRDDLQVLLEPEALLVLRAAVILHDQPEMIDPAPGAAADGDLALPSRTILRKHALHGLIAPAVTADRLQTRSDILDCMVDCELLDDELAQRDARRRRIALGHQQAEYLV